jgi:peptidoglycan/xylan/chitin deacetylase (PgdA/CDA1 family)
MLYLRRHYRILHLEDALEELYTPYEGKRIHDRRIPLVLTFDDGYRDNYTYGFPLACELQVPITIFLIPGNVQSGDYFWWLEGNRLVHRARVDKVTIGEQTYHLAQATERKDLAKTIDAHLRYATSVQEREDFLRDTRVALDVPHHTTAEEETTLPLTWAQIEEMEKSGWVSFGAHTMHHPILAHLSNVAEVQYEVEECRKMLEQHTEHPILTFAYPVGKFEHFGNTGLNAVKQAGYKWALTTVESRSTLHSDPHLLPRLPGDITQYWQVMAAELVGLLGVLHRLRKKS